MTFSRWVRSRLFRSYLWAFVLLWLVAKGAMVGEALVPRMADLTAAPGPSAVWRPRTILMR